jgi:hypothetical protein
MCVLIFCTAFVWNISHSKENYLHMINVYWSSCEVPAIIYIWWMSIGLHVKYPLLSTYDQCLLVVTWSTRCYLHMINVYWSSREVPAIIYIWSTSIGLHVKCPLLSTYDQRLLVFTWSTRYYLHVINVYWSSCKVPAIFVRFERKLYFLDNIRKILKLKVSLKFVYLESSCSTRTCGRTDAQTDMTSLVVAFCNFANAFKNLKFSMILKMSRCRVFGNKYRSNFKSIAISKQTNTKFY